MITKNAEYVCSLFGKPFCFCKAILKLYSRLFRNTTEVRWELDGEIAVQHGWLHPIEIS
jgi:hypothetical protein